MLSGCASAWVVEQTPQGGVIGDKHFSDADELHKAIAALVSCPSNDEMTFDRLAGEIVNVPVSLPSNTSVNDTGSSYGAGGYTRYSGQGTITTWETQNVAVTKRWREFGYSCVANVPLSTPWRISQHG